MQLNEDALRELIIRIINEVKNENIDSKNSVLKEKLYIILTEPWNKIYDNFVRRLEKQEEYEVYIAFSDKISSLYNTNEFMNFKGFKGIINKIEDISFEEDFMVVFPLTSRNLVVKTALCINDTFESNWIFKAMEYGKRIILLKSGFEKFSGKESEKYVDKILDYYKTLLEFNIEISDWIDKSPEAENLLPKNVEIQSDKYRLMKNSKKIITEIELENYVYDNEIILNSGDIITDKALDKAKSLNICILKQR